MALGGRSIGVDLCAAHDLIATKARRIWQLNPHGRNPNDDWLLAESYVQRFYGNIVDAVVNGDCGCVALVANAFDFCIPFHDNLRIVNAFEAAILMYFVDAEVIRHVLNCNPQMVLM